MTRIVVSCGLVLLFACAGEPTASAQGTSAQGTGRPSPRRQFVTVTIDWMKTLPLHFKSYPLEQLTGKELGEIQLGPEDYRSRDGSTTVDVFEFRRRNRGAGVTVYPLGAANGAALAIRASYETLPVIRFEIRGPGGVEQYRLTDGRAYDIGVGVIVSDRSAGWGLGAHSFVLAGLGRLTGERGDGRRYFGEGGGGFNVGPLGLQLSVKFAFNRLHDPREHDFFTVPVTLRGTLSF